MRAWLHHPWALRLAAFVLGGTFLVAAYPKIQEPQEFARIVYHYRMIGPSQSIHPMVPNAFAATLPWVEVVSALLLITGIWRREAAFVTTLMLVMFLIAVGWAMAHGIDVENCGCFSVSGEGRGAGWKLIAGDTALLLLALWLVRAPAERRATADAPQPTALSATGA